MNILIPVLIVAAMGLILGLGLALASKFMAVPTDEREAKIRECLPGANCGACGYTGCDGYAAAIASGEAEPDKCAPGGESTAKALGEVNYQGDFSFEADNYFNPMPEDFMPQGAKYLHDVGRYLMDIIERNRK